MKVCKGVFFILRECEFFRFNEEFIVTGEFFRFMGFVFYF